MLGWFQRLMPHQPLFFALFERHAATVTGAAEALRRMLDGGDQIGQHCRSVMRLEEEADGITRDVLIGVRSTFITPFDRGDIKDLITAHRRRHRPDAEDRQGHHPVRDDEPSSRRCARWPTTSSSARNWSRAPCRCWPTSASMSDSSTRSACRSAGSKGAADEIHDRGLKALYQRSKAGDPMEFVRGDEIYDHLEKSVDRFDDVANQIQGVVIEHV